MTALLFVNKVYTRYFIFYLTGNWKQIPWDMVFKGNYVPYFFMKSHFFISLTAWKSLERCFDREKATHRPGNRSDLKLYQEHAWLKDTAVVEQLIPQKGAWNIYLVFAHYRNPLKLIRKSITTYTCYRKAELMSSCLRRNAAKDARGTLEVDVKLLNEPFN